MDGLPYLLILLALAVVVIAGWWKLFEKAGEAGWKSIIPFLNTYTMFRIAGRNGWAFLLLLIPLVNLVVAVVVSINLAEHYGKSSVYGFFFLFLLPIIGALDLGFGDAKYIGNKHA